MTADTKQPGFSIIIPVHNRVELLRRALQSVVVQTLRDFEVIVVDDGSTEDVGAVVRELNDPRVRLIRQEKAGQGAASNAGVDQARGEYLAFLDSDDEATEGWLAGFAQGFASSGADVVCCGTTVVRAMPDGNVETSTVLPRPMGGLFQDREAMFLSGAYSLRRDLFLSIGGYTTGLRSFLQTDFFLRLTGRQEGALSIHNVMQPLVRIHIHPGPRVRGNPESLYYGAVHILTRHSQRLAVDRHHMANYLTCAGVNALRIGRVAESRKYLLDAVRWEPRRARRWARLFVSLYSPLATKVWSRPDKPNVPL